MEQTIIKLQSPVDVHESNEGVAINKIHSSISPSEFIKLLRKADNKVNPREAKKGPITGSIIETLEKYPELFWFKTKGILLATTELALLERNRIRLSLDDHDFEGIMDGGHNALALASFLVEKIHGETFDTWEECRSYWQERGDEILADFEARKDEFRPFSIPLEIIYPGESDAALDQFRDHIADICHARNNNVQLKSSTKANHKGLYDALKASLPNNFKIVWRSGEEGNIKSEKVISMATLPLIALQERGLLPEGVSPISLVSIYSQESKCVAFYNQVLEDPSISTKDGKIHKLGDERIASGLKMVADILVFFDRMYAAFPRLYNNVSPGFGRIKSVDDKKKKIAPFRTEESEYTYPPGFIYPLVTGLIELIDYDSTTDSLSWKISPDKIRLDELDMTQYIEAIKLANYDPQTVGKGSLFYNLARSIYQGYLRKQ